MHWIVEQPKQLPGGYVLTLVVSSPPSLDRSPTATEARGSAMHKSQPSLHILLIEDNEDDIAAVSRVVTRGKLDVTLAVSRDGQAALDSLRSDLCEGTRLPDVILLDVTLPGMSGIDVLRQIKDAPAFVDTPVILLTGSDNEEHVRSGQLFGAHSQLAKPLTVGQFDWIAKAVMNYQQRLSLLTGLKTSYPHNLSLGCRLRQHRLW